LDKNNIMMIVILALLVLLLGTIGFMSVYLINFFNNNAAGGATEEAREMNTDIPQNKLLMVTYDDDIKGTIQDKGSTGTPHAIVFRLSIAIDNLSEDKKDIAKAEELQALIEDREDVVKSAVSDVIYSHSFQDYNTKTNDEMKSALTLEILEKLRAIFGSNLIYEVYLSNYLFQ